MSTDSLRATDDYSATRATHPRVSLADMEAKIARKDFINAGECVFGSDAHDAHPLDLLTICLLTTTSGFTIIGKSAPASPENYDIEKGQTFAYEDAIKQLWPLEGYLLRDRLAA